MIKGKMVNLTRNIIVKAKPRMPRCQYRSVAYIKSGKDYAGFIYTSDCGCVMHRALRKQTYCKRHFKFDAYFEFFS